MSLSLIILIVVLFAFIISSIEDIKKREVYDYINYSFTFIVLCVAIFDSVLNLSFEPVKYVGFGLLVGFALGSLLYYIGIWGGGDAKFLIGFAASSYYLMDFVSRDSYFHRFYEVMGVLFSNFFDIVISLIFNVAIAFNVILLIVIVLKLVLTKRKSEYKDLFLLFGILLFLFLGLYLNYSGFTLIFLGFLSFVLIFFADEEIFNSVYFLKKKSVLDLKEGDRLDGSIKNSGVEVLFAEAKFGLTKENIFDIKKKIQKDFDVYVRRVIPYGYLVALNYVAYILKIITLDEMNLFILGFLFKFLFFSFIVGGIVAILFLFYCFIRNYKKVKYGLQRSEKLILGVVFFVSMFFGLIDYSFMLFALFVPIYFFIKVARQLEKLMFVSKKKVSLIVLGDWVVQDIKVGDKLIYAAEDFKLGVDEKQLEKLKKLAKKYKSLSELYVKDGLAFLPPLFIGFLIMLFI